jgi:hypothetical protein
MFISENNDITTDGNHHAIMSVFIGKINNPPYEPSNPDPYDGETHVDIDHDLSWIGGDPDPGDIVIYDVYFGTTSPPSQVVWGQSATTYDPGTLDYETLYYWKIVAWDNHGYFTAGTVWQYTTGDSLGQPVEPSAYSILRGKYISGDLSDLFTSDDSYLDILAGLTLFESEPPVWLEIEGTSPLSTPIEITFILEAHIDSPGIVSQQLDLYNYNLGEYETVDIRPITLSDQIVEVVITTNPSRFIHPSTNEMRAQFSWLATGPTSTFPWMISIDQSIWTIL